MAVFLSAEAFSNPYPLAQRLRETDPVHWSEEFRAWVLTRYADVAAGLHDPRFAADRMPQLSRLETLNLEWLRPLFSATHKMILFQDPPDHTRLKGLANRAFTRPIVEGWRATIQQLVDGLLDRAEQAETLDVIADFARPLPLAVISMVLGFPDAARERLKAWSDEMAPFFGNFSHTGPQMTAAQRAVLEFSEYIRTLVRDRRRGSGRGNDLMSLLAHDVGGALTEDELVANVILLVGAGHVTTTDLIGNGTLALLQHPEQASRVGQSRPASGLMESAIEELLRYDSPVQMTARLIKDNVEIDGRRIARGQWVVLWLGAANRDPARFSRPDDLDLERPDNRHLAFGSGAHFCVGAPLARLQAQIALGTLFRRCPDMALQDRPLTWGHSSTLRSLTSLPVWRSARKA